MGLAGLGDLVLTCTDDQSRNRRFGLLLARGRGVDAALREIGQVVEGYQAARAVQAVAARERVTMPICEGIHGVLYEGLPAADVVQRADATADQAGVRLGPRSPAEALLPPGLVDDHGHGVGQVQAAVAGAHRDAQELRRRQSCRAARRQAAGLADRTAARRRAEVAPRAWQRSRAGLDREHARRAQGSQAGGQVGVARCTTASSW